MFAMCFISLNCADSVIVTHILQMCLICFNVTRKHSLDLASLASVDTYFETS